MNSFESALNPTSCLFSQAAEIQPPDRIGIPNVEAYLQKQINIKLSLFSRRVTARGSCTGPVTVGPT